MLFVVNLGFAGCNDAICQLSSLRYLSFWSALSWCSCGMWIGTWCGTTLCVCYCYLWTAIGSEMHVNRLFQVLIYRWSSTKPHHQWPVKPKNSTMDVVYLTETCFLRNQPAGFAKNLRLLLLARLPRIWRLTQVATVVCTATYFPWRRRRSLLVPPLVTTSRAGKQLGRSAFSSLCRRLNAIAISRILGCASTDSDTSGILVSGFSPQV